MASVNKAIIIGNLGADPEVRYTQAGDSIGSFSVATTEKWRDKQTGEQREATEWHRITTFGKLAEICSQYLRKGSLVYVEGSLRTRKYTDRDGIERYNTEIRADTLKMLGGRPDGEGHPQQRQAAPQRQQAPQQQYSNSSGFDDMSEDIPF